MVMYLSDVENLGFSEDTIRYIKDRLSGRFSFGTNLPENYVVVYPHIVAFEMKTEDKIIHKFNYTVVHELTHGLLQDTELNTEPLCHALSMILTDDIESNVSGLGHADYRTMKGRIEIVANDTEDEEPQTEAQTPEPPQNMAERTNAARNLSIMRLAQHHELTGL